MKATKFFQIFSLVLILSGMVTVSASAINESSVPSFSQVPPVTYVVNIAQGNNPEGFSCTYYVVIVDERGHRVAPAELFRYGVWSYTFKEYGKVSGSRTALMVKDPMMLCPKTYIFAPQTITGPFGIGKTFIFNLSPGQGAGGNGSGISE